MKHVILPIFVPHMGCPHQCVFCNQYKIAGEWPIPDAEEMEMLAKDWFESSGVRPELAFYGGSFTAIDEQIQLSLLTSAYKLKMRGLIKGIRLSTRPDALDESILERLKQYAVDTIEIGVQSLDETVLLKSGRGHDAQTAIDAISRVKSYGFSCGVQLMIALPGDTPEKSLKTCQQVIQASPSFVRLYPTMVIKKTALEKSYLSGAYRPWSFDELVETVATMSEELQKADIPIIRIGLQAEENLTSGDDIVAGGYHPAFGEYVLARVFRHQMLSLLQKEENDTIIFHVSPKYHSQAVGQKKENIRFIEELTNQQVLIIDDETIKDNKVSRG